MSRNIAHRVSIRKILQVQYDENCQAIQIQSVVKLEHLKESMEQGGELGNKEEDDEKEIRRGKK